MRRYPFDLFEDLASSISKKSDKNDGKQDCYASTCPHAIIFILNIPMSTLLDSGSQVTCISEAFYAYLSKLSKLTELPVANIVVLTAIKETPTPVRKQVMLEIKVEELKVSAVFLVIPHLSSSLIVGSDWLLRLRAIIDFSSRSLTINGTVIPPELVSFGRPPSECLSVSEDDDYTYIQILRVNNSRTRLDNSGAQNPNIPQERNSGEDCLVGKYQIIRGYRRRKCR